MSGPDARIPGDGTKFSDHYQAFGITQMPPLDLSMGEEVTADDALLCREVMTIAPRYEALLKVAPLDVLPDFMAAARQLSGRVKRKLAA
jgi:hypothetical protein